MKEDGMFKNLLGRLTKIGATGKPKMSPATRESEMSPKKKIGLGLAAGLYASMDDYGNAQALYKKIGDETRATEMDSLLTDQSEWLKEASNLTSSDMGQKNENEWLNDGNRNKEKIKEIEQNLGELLSKIANMLSNLKPHESSILFHEDPNYQKVMELMLEAFPDSKFREKRRIDQFDQIRNEITNKIIERKLGSLRRVTISKTNNRGDDISIRGLLELATYEGNSLVLYGGRVEVLESNTLRYEN